MELSARQSKGVNIMAKVRVIKYQAVYEAINELEYIQENVLPSSMGMRGMSKAQLIDTISELEEYIEHVSQVLRYAKIMQVEEVEQ